MNYSKKLMKTDSVIEVFDLVKEAVEDALGESRAGMDLGFVEMGNTRQCIFALHPVGSNIIVMNKTPIRRIMETKPGLLKPYVFTTLLHEYIHSLGYLDEETARRLTCMITRQLFGDTLASDMACNLDKYMNYVTYPGGFPAIEEEMIVLETDEQDYIG